MILEMIGLIAGVLTTAAFVPQVYKTWKSRSAKDLSLGMFLVFVTGVALWLCYGIVLQNTPIIMANAVTLVLTSFLLYFKMTFEN